MHEVTTTGVEWAPAPQRHEAGTPNVLGVAALAAACDALCGLDAATVRAHEEALCARLREGLAAVPGVEVLRLWRDSTDSVGIVAFTVDGYEADVVAAYLSAEHGIGVRDGRFCAHPLLARLGLDAAVRASIGLGTSGADVERLLAAVTDLVECGPSWNYDRSTGRAAPSPETRSFPITLSAGGSPCA